MDLIREELPAYSIHSYTLEAIIINNNSEQKEVSLPLFLSNNYLKQPAQLEQIKEYIAQSKIDILIIGTPTPLDPQVYVALRSMIECEAMNITAAIYSYNILIGDYRNAGILLLTK